MNANLFGRTSFKAVKNKRDYLHRRTSFNWLYWQVVSLKEHVHELRCTKEDLTFQRQLI